MKLTNDPADRKIFNMSCLLAALFALGCALLYFGTRTDAVTVARSLKSGVLTADEVNVAFENVGGRLLRHEAEESDAVEPGAPLLVLDPTDTDISIAAMRAKAEAQRAQIAEEEHSYRVAVFNTDLKEKTEWRRIESLQAAIEAESATLALAEAEFRRADALVEAKAVSRSVYDNAKSTLARSRSALVQARRDLAIATVGASREEMDRLVKRHAADGMRLDSIAAERLSNENIKNSIASLKAELRQTESELSQLEVNRGRLTLKSPERGRILRLLFEDGEIIQAGTPAVLLESARKYFDFYVNEAQVSGYPPGSRITAWAPALGREVAGTVRFATAAPSFSDLRNTREKGQSDLTSFQVRVYTDETPGLLAGMTLEVRTP